MNITQKSILDEVAKATAYLGAKRGEYDRLATVDANDEILGRYWREAVAEAALALGPSGTIALTDSPVELATITLAPGIDPALAESLLRAFLIERVVARWLALAGIEPTDAEAVANPFVSGCSLADLAATASGTRSFSRPLSPF